MNLYAELVELFSDRKCNCTAYAAAYNANFLVAVCMSRNTERAYKIVKAVALI